MDAFDAWTRQVHLPNTQSLQELGHSTEGPCIGIDAVYFLEELEFPSKGSLAPVLGSFSPLAESQIVRTIRDIESAGCKIYFFFDGLETIFDENSLAASSIARSKNARVTQSQGTIKDKSTIEQSLASGVPSNAWFCAALKVILHEHEIPFVVAPFKAHAQMVHALQQGAVDTLYGPSDMFLYGASQVITKIRLNRDPTENSTENVDANAKSRLDLEQSKVIWLDLDQCLKMLGDVPLELFQDAMYLVGTRSLEPFPPLRDSLDPQASLHFKEVVTSLNQVAGNILQYCERYAPVIRGNWLDRYMRTHQAIKHMIILYDYNTVKPRTYLNAQRIDRPPSDIHELVGLQLPAEIHHYLYRGMISPRVLNWLVSGKIKLSVPLSGGDSEIYRNLVKNQLDPWRKQSLALPAYTLSHYWQRKEFVTQSWLATDNVQKFSMKDLTTEKQRISRWRVKEPLLKDRLQAIQKSHKDLKIGSLQFAVLSLSDSSFVPKTVTPAKRSNTEAQLQSSQEIISNVLWRLLQLRGYVNEQHELTPWGKVLQAALGSSSISDEAGQSILVIVELARLGLLERTETISKEQGALTKLESDSEIASASIVLHIACTGKSALPSKVLDIPLSSQILAYHALVTEIRLALRDLIDMTLLTMFLDDEVERARDDLLDIASSLPFQTQWSADLAVITASAFQETKGSEATTSSLFDAFDAAVQVAGTDTLRPEQKKAWTEASLWYKSVR